MIGEYTPEQIAAGNVAIGDMGELYGYSYQPERFTESDKPVTGTSTYEPWDGIQGHHPTKFPVFASCDEAVAFLKARGYYGHVQRYCNDETGAMSWVTAGITDIVNAPTDGPLFVSVMTALAGDVTVHRRGA